MAQPSDIKQQSWYNEFNLYGSDIYWPRTVGSELTPSYAELIQRNLSTLRYTLRKLQAADTNAERTAWEDEAKRHIREHNRLVRTNRKIRRSL